MKQRLLSTVLFLCLVLLLPAATADSLFPVSAGNAPSSGVVKFPVIRISFTDEQEFFYTETDIRDVFDSEADAAPWDSVRAYYLRSSFGQLDWQADAVITVSLPHTRSYYGHAQDGRRADLLVSSAIALADAEIDFSRYDSDGDGRVDAVFFAFAGENEEWDTLFWPHATLFPEELTADGVTFGKYCMFGEDDIEVLCHETGHLLGLPDYYNYAMSGNLQDLNTPDLMRDNTGDHNAFSKMLLGWTQPRVITPAELENGPITVKMTSLTDPSASEPRLIILSLTGETPFDEYLAVEYVRADENMTGLDLKDSAGGFRIYRVNALTDDEGQFLFDDNYGTMTQLIAALQEEDSHRPLEGTLFGEGDRIACDTNPAACLFDGNVRGFTGFVLEGFITGDEPGFTLGLEAEPVQDGHLTLNADRLTTEEPFEFRLVADRDVTLSGEGSATLCKDMVRIPLWVEADPGDYRTFILSFNDWIAGVFPTEGWEVEFSSRFFEITDDVYSLPLRVRLYTRTGTPELKTDPESPLRFPLNLHDHIETLLFDADYGDDYEQETED